MAAALSESGLEEGEYESDSDGASALALRRREASDDEEREIPLDAVSSAGGEDDEDDDDDDVDASQHSFSDEEGEGEGTPPDGEEALVRRRRLVSDEEDDREGLHHEGGSRRSADKEDGSQGTAPADVTDGKEAGEEEKKDAEPFVVPTAGAFYMHDDRFRGVAGARPRRGVGGSRKLWEAKDEKPWVHDLFEELNVRDDSYRDEGLSRGGRGRSRGRGRVNRDRNRGWVGKLASDSEELYLNRARRGRGRGRPARSEADHSRVEETGPSTTKGAQLGSTGSSNVEGQDESKKHDSTAPRKVVAGSLNSASPPFFPSSALQHKSVDLGSESNQTIVSQSAKGKERATRSGSQVFVAKSGGSARGLQVGALQSSAQSQPPVKPPAAQTTAQNARSSSGQGQPPVPPSAQPQLQQAHDQEAHAPGTVTQASSGSIPANLGQSVQPARPKSTGGRGGRGGNIQVVGGRGGSFVYHGGPATGMNNGVQKVEPGFAPPIPAVGPVAVQYAGHPPAGIPLPAVGMAMSNYSGQPQYGFPNSEVTWIPVLAGGGAIGASYATPYMTMEGTPSPMYFSQPAAQPPPSFRPAGNSSKPSGLWKPPPNEELGPDDFGHRQSKPRRYSEMNFGQ